MNLRSTPLLSSLLQTSLVMSVSSLLLAFISIALGQRVNYLDYLPFFNAMALVMLSLGVGALLLGLLGTWRTRGRSLPLWFANVLALLVLSLYLFD